VVVGDGGAALHVDQDAVPGIADLAGEQTEAVDLAGVGLAGEQETGAAAFEIRPVALRFQAEDQRRHLPAIADLATDRSAGRVVAAFVAEAVRVPVEAAGRATAVDTDVEATPVVAWIGGSFVFRPAGRSTLPVFCRPSRGPRIFSGEPSD
jgi:hypothetical protein